MATIRRAMQRLLSPSRQSIFVHRVRLFSSEHGPDVVDLSTEESKRRLFNRLQYRSRQRGFLELDLVLGNWVAENIRSMDESRIKALVQVLDLENPDLWKWLTGQEQPPEAVNKNPVFTAVHAKVMGNLDSHASAATRANPGQPWVRGWDDKRGLDGPKIGNHFTDNAKTRRLEDSSSLEIPGTSQD